MALTIGKGRGYVPAEENTRSDAANWNDCNG